MEEKQRQFQLQIEKEAMRITGEKLVHQVVDDEIE